MDEQSPLPQATHNNIGLGYTTVALSIVLFVCIAGIWYFFNMSREEVAISSSPAVTSNEDVQELSVEENSREIQSDEIGLRSVVPKDWIVSEQTGSNDSKIFEIRSPDYQTKEVEHDCYGEGCDPVTTVVVSGARFVIYSTIPTTFALSLYDPARFADFEYQLYKDCSNCFSVDRQAINGIPAVIHGTRFIQDGQEVLKAALMRNNRHIAITFDYATSTPTIRSVFDKFIDQTVFVPEKKLDSTGLLSCVLRGLDLNESLKQQWQGVQVGAPHEHISSKNGHCYISYQIFSKPGFAYIRDMDNGEELIKCQHGIENIECDTKFKQIMAD